MKKSLLFTAILMSAGTMTANAAFVQNGSEVNLNEFINDTLLVDGAAVDVLGDTDTSDAQTNPYWFASEGDSTATLLLEITSGFNEHSFGIFNGDDYVQLFEGTEGGVYENTSGFNSPVADSGNLATVAFFFQGGDYKVMVNGQQEGSFASADFGFYLGNGGAPIYYSDSSKNPNQEERFVAVNGSDQRLNLGSEADFNCSATSLLDCTLWENDDWIIGFEDGGDFDYNDMVVYVEDVLPVPEPGTLALIGLGLAGLGVSRRRKQA